MLLDIPCAPVIIEMTHYCIRQTIYPSIHNLITVVCALPCTYRFGVFCFVMIILWFSVFIYIWYVYIYIIQGYFTGTGVILRLPQCQWSNPEGYGWNRSLHNPTKTLQNTKQTRNVWNCDYLVASEIALMYMGKIGRYTTQQNTAKHDTEWIIHDLYNAIQLNRDVSLFFSTTYKIYAKVRPCVLGYGICFVVWLTGPGEAICCRTTEFRGWLGVWRQQTITLTMFIFHQRYTVLLAWKQFCQK